MAAGNNGRLQEMADMMVDKLELQNRLFAELSRMFAVEVPLYDRSLRVNQVCNRTICDLLAAVYPDFQVDADCLEQTSGERHGAIRIGRPDEYRWVARLFACFAMEPHNFYDMANVGAKSQPIIATAFRSRHNPEHRVFCSLLLTDYFDTQTKARIDAALAQRQVVSPAAQRLIEQSEREGGLNAADATALITECTTKIFKWTGQAIDFPLYQQLCQAGFKIAADIACFPSHHLNHLTPNSFGIDIYTSAMKYCLGEVSSTELSRRLRIAATRLTARADHHLLRLLFRHLTAEHCAALPRQEVPNTFIEQLVSRLMQQLQQPELDLTQLNHSGFKDATEGPSEDTPVLLRQDAYKALAEPVTFHNPDGTTVAGVHTARFGEIEQRFYATTQTGRRLYDECLAAAEASLAAAGSSAVDFSTREQILAHAFSQFPKTLPELRKQGLVHVRYAATEAGKRTAGQSTAADLDHLIEQGWVRFEGLRYEDFLPVSAAGIFASNLNQYGTQAATADRPVYQAADLERIMGREIIDTTAQYAAWEAESLTETLRQLGSDC
jgi:uncharacterized glyoxalase superfamily metalloenzyme YdcJ